MRKGCLLISLFLLGIAAGQNQISLNLTRYTYWDIPFALPVNFTDNGDIPNVEYKLNIDFNSYLTVVFLD